MLYLSNKLYNIPLLSLRSARRIGTIIEPIINPHNLHIDGFYSNIPSQQHPLILLDVGVRSLSPKGIIIDDNNDLSEPGDLIRLKPVLDINFKILEKSVLSGKKKMGKVVEYAIDQESLFIQKIYTQPSIWQGINQHRLTFDRASVIEVTDTHIIVSSSEEKLTKKVTLQNPSVQTSYSASNSLIKE